VTLLCQLRRRVAAQNPETAAARPASKAAGSFATEVPIPNPPAAMFVLCINSQVRSWNASPAEMSIDLVSQKNWQTSVGIRSTAHGRKTQTFRSQCGDLSRTLPPGDLSSSLLGRRAVRSHKPNEAPGLCGQFHLHVFTTRSPTDRSRAIAALYPRGASKPITS
jgi:hypothetical protein